MFNVQSWLPLFRLRHKYSRTSIASCIFDWLDIYWWRFDGVAIYFLKSDFKFFDDASRHPADAYNARQYADRPIRWCIINLHREPHNDGQLHVSHRLSRHLNNATGQCPVVCPSHVDNDRTVAHGVWTYRCPVVPSLFRPTVQRANCSGSEKSRYLWEITRYHMTLSIHKIANMQHYGSWCHGDLLCNRTILLGLQCLKVLTVSVETT